MPVRKPLRTSIVEDSGLAEASVNRPAQLEVLLGDPILGTRTQTSYLFDPTSETLHLPKKSAEWGLYEIFV